MPKYRITLPDGRKVMITKDTPPDDNDINEIMSQGETSTGLATVLRPFMRGFEKELVPFTEKTGQAIVPGDYSERPGEQEWYSKGSEFAGRIAGMVPLTVATAGLVNPLVTKATAIPKVAAAISALSKTGKVGQFLARSTPGLLKAGTEASVLGFTRETKNPAFSKEGIKERAARTGEYAGSAAATELLLMPALSKILGKIFKRPIASTAEKVVEKTSETKISPPGYYGTKFREGIEGQTGNKSLLETLGIVSEKDAPKLLPPGNKKVIPLNPPAPKNFTPLVVDPSVAPDIAEKSQILKDLIEENSAIDDIIRNYELLKKRNPSMMKKNDILKILSDNKKEVLRINKDIDTIIKENPLKLNPPKYPNVQMTENINELPPGKTPVNANEIPKVELTDNQRLAIQYLNRTRSGRKIQIGNEVIGEGGGIGSDIETEIMGSPVEASMGETGGTVSTTARPTVPEATTTGATKKLKVGGGEYSTAIFNEKGGDAVEQAIRARSKEIEAATKLERGTAATQLDVDSIKVEDILKKNTRTGVSDAETKATAEFINNSQKKIISMKEEMNRLIGQGDLNASSELQRQIAAEESVLDKLLTKWYGGGTASGRALAARQAARQQIADVLETPANRIKQQILKTVDDWGGEAEANRIIEGLNTFDPNDKEALLSYVRQNYKAGPFELLETFWRNNVLTGTGTHIANTTGNVLRSTFHVLSKPVRVGTDIIRSAITKTPREEFIKEWGPEVIGLFQGYKEGLGKAISAFKSGMRQSDIAELKLSKPAFTGKYSQWIQTPDRLLLALDEFSRSANETMEIYRQAAKMAIKEGAVSESAFSKRVGELVANPTAEMLKKAEILSTKLLYQEMSQELSSAGQIRNLINIKGFRPLYYIMPFVQTPVNVLKFITEWSPLGFASLLRKGIPAEEINRKLASAFIGSSFISGMYLYYGQHPDDITGKAPPKGSREEQAFYASGKIPNAIKVRINGQDRWVQYSRVDPLGPWLGIIANTLQMTRNGELTENGALEGIFRFSLASANSLLDRTFLSGIKDLLDASTSEGSFRTFLGNLMSGFIPGSALMGNIARAQDRIVREPENVEQVLETKIPGMSQNVPPKSSKYEKNKVSNRNYPWWQEFLPIKITDPVDNYLAEAYLKQLEKKRVYNKKVNERKKEIKNKKFKSSGLMK